MKLTWLGHSSFLLETANGTRIVTDPYDQNILAHSVPKADLVTVSHEHFDHNAVDTLPQYGEVLRGAKEWDTPDVHITGYASWHDEVQGKKRGPNTVFVFEADGLKIAHLGDLGEELSPSLKEALTDLDALLIPVGGTFTVDGKQAIDIINELKPRYTVPMHYRVSGHTMDKIDDGRLFFASLDKSVPMTKAPALTFTEPEGIVVLENR